METTISVTIILLLAFVEPLMWEKFWQVTVQNRTRYYSKRIVGLVLLVIFNLIASYFRLNLPKMNVLFYWLNSAYLVVFLIYAVRYYQIKAVYAFEYLAFIHIINVLNEYLISGIVIFIIKIPLGKITSPTYSRCMAYISMLCLQGIAMHVLVEMDIKYKKNIRSKYSIALVYLVYIMNILVFTSFLLPEKFKKSQLIGVRDIIVFLTEIILFIVALYFTVEGQKKVNEYQQIIQYKDKQIELLATTQEKIQEVKKVSHDMKNNLHTIGSLLDNERYDAAKDYLDKLIPLVQSAKIPDFNDTTLCVILFEKSAKARCEGCVLDYQITVSDIDMPVIELNSIISNMIDNAIEASKKIKPMREKRIDFSIHVKEDNLVVECVNHYQEEPVIRNDGKFETSKEDKENHGQGISLIYENVEKNHGQVDISFANGIFVIKVIFNKELAVI